MLDIRERVDYRLIECHIHNKKISDIFTEKVAIADAKEWNLQLKLEVIYWGQYDIGFSELTRAYVKKNWESILNVSGTDEYVANLYYVDEKTGGEAHKYLYDSNVDMVYKIPTSRVGEYRINSVEELNYQQGNNNVDSRLAKEKTITLESNITSASNESYYEPDLSGFATTKTKIIYYSSSDEELEVSAEQYLALDSANRRTKTVASTTYEFYNYQNKRWANIKVTNEEQETWWVWIPRYAYKINGTATEIIFIDLENKNAKTGASIPSDYIVHPAFGDNLKGIWVSKYEPSMVVNTAVDEIPFYMPDMSGFDAENTYIEVFDGEDGFEETKLSNIKDLTQFAKDNKWFDYYRKIWANIKVVKDGIETWWVWIPRYAYNQTGTNTSIIFVDTANNPISGEELTSNYIVHPAFGNDLKGIWVSKYEPSHVVENPPTTNNVNIPDMSGFDANNTYIELYNEDGTFQDVKLSTISNLETFIASNNWYDYSKQIWANIKVVKDGTETWWVWIPKYAYNITGTETGVIFLNADGTTKDGTSLPSNYIPHPAFSDGLSGIWASKFEPSNK